jgi:hypothetical protein
VPGFGYTGRQGMISGSGVGHDTSDLSLPHHSWRSSSSAAP